MRMLKTFIGAMLAGISIGLGGLVFLSLDDKVVGAALFTVGLFTICTMGLTRNAAAFSEKAAGMCQTKLNDSLISLFFLGVLCNILIYIAVETFRNNEHEIGKYLALIFGVMVFILSGTEHCVADISTCGWGKPGTDEPSSAFW